MWARTLCPLSSSTLKKAFGSDSTTVPSISMAPSFLAMPSALYYLSVTQLACLQAGACGWLILVREPRATRSRRPGWLALSGSRPSAASFRTLTTAQEPYRVYVRSAVSANPAARRATTSGNSKPGRDIPASSLAGPAGQVTVTSRQLALIRAAPPVDVPAATLRMDPAYPSAEQDRPPWRGNPQRPNVAVAAEGPDHEQDQGAGEPAPPGGAPGGLVPPARLRLAGLASQL